MSLERLLMESCKISDCTNVCVYLEYGQYGTLNVSKKSIIQV